ncbi:unnamed protein product [Macrosiphum euphorbiae]|uniref:Uncharacterized protein n=1 Tax=Macrosiphum euphorbiae TaxID=13131 RepID=A0AAV0XH92_9HEMI|nr:unnamed protein product [Macrosiphum euphorbiae]
MSSKQIQKFKDEIEALKKENRDQKEAHEEDIQYLEKKNCDRRSINADSNTEIERLKKKNHELVIKNQEIVDENQDLQKENLELVAVKSKLNAKIEEYKEKQQEIEQQLCAKFEKLAVYAGITLSPVPVDKLQHCTEWWCPKHSKFATIVDELKQSIGEDKLIIDRAKARFKYWNSKPNGETCCKNNRKYKDRNTFLPPSNWPK